MAKKNFEREIKISNFVDYLCQEISTGSGFVPRWEFTALWKNIFPETPFPSNGSQLLSDRLETTFPRLTSTKLVIAKSTVGNIFLRSDDPKAALAAKDSVAEKIKSNLDTRKNKQNL
jgi:hypothetical protein